MVLTCCVKECKSESYKGSGVSFHRFPKDEEIKNKWLTVIPGNVTKYSAVCSLHFKADDFATHPAALRKILKVNAIPSVFPVKETSNRDSPPGSPLDCQTEEDDIDMLDPLSDYTMASCDLKACRVCLAPGQLRRMSDRARRAYGLLTGLPTSSDGHLPPYVCTECSHRLKNFIRFRTASLRAHLLVLEATKKNKQVTLESIKSVAGDRRIGSSLSVTHNQPDHYDLQIEHEEDNDLVTDGDDDGDCDVKREPDEMDSEDSLDYEFRPDDTNDDIDISEVKIETESDAIRATDHDNEDCGDLDSEVVKRFKSNDNVNNFDKQEKASVPHKRMAVKNNTVNKNKCEDKVVTNNPKVYCVVNVPRLPEVNSISKDKDGAVPGHVMPVGR